MKFNRLTFIADVHQRSADGRKVAQWLCDCGQTKELPISRVKGGYVKSCGCLALEVSSVKATIHGMRRSPEYSSWQAMKARCLDPNNKDYPRWGGKGVTVYQEWVDSFEEFYKHIGPRPKGTSIDRKNTLRGYEPGNVRWATPSEQACNRANSLVWIVKGQVFESAEAAAAHFGVSDVTIHRWVKGYFDPRRSTFRPKIEGCDVSSRY